MTFSKKLRSVRERLGLSQEKTAEILSTSAAYIAHIENGRAVAGQEFQKRVSWLEANPSVVEEQIIREATDFRAKLDRILEFCRNGRQAKKADRSAKFRDVLTRLADGETCAEIAAAIGEKQGVVYGRARRMAKLLWMEALMQQRNEGYNPNAKWIPYFTKRSFAQWLRDNRAALKV